MEIVKNEGQKTKEDKDAGIKAGVGVGGVGGVGGGVRQMHYSEITSQGAKHQIPFWPICND